jgi:hypothetical protein
MICLSQSKVFSNCDQRYGGYDPAPNRSGNIETNRNYQRWRIVGDIIWGCKGFDAAGESEIRLSKKISGDAARRVHA